MAIACPLPVLNTNAFPTTARGRFFNRTSSSNESRRFNLSFRNGRLAHRATCTISPRAFMGPGQGQKPYTSVMIVPTGVGASIGGFAGDALPVARATASIVDCLISHPNVLNAAMLYWPMSNVLYVEGYALDRFAEGLWGLQPVHQNKVGLVLDAGIEEELRLRHLQVADAARASLGLSVVQCVVTDTTLQVEKWVDAKTGQSTGRVGHPDSLLRAVDTLVNHANVNAVAIVGRFPDDSLDELEDYRQGKGIDVLAGVEAIISHLVVQEFHIPCAHAPALLPLPSDPLLSPRSAAEEIGYTFLPCVLAGLSRAPQYVVRKVEYPLGISRQGCIWAGDVDSVIVPFDACGGAGILAFGCKEGSKPLIIAVEENETVLNDTPDKLALDVVKVANYWEALGVIAAHKSGVDPQSLRRHGVNRIQCSPSVPRQESFVNSKLQVSPTIAQITSGISPDSADGNIYYDGHRTNCIQTRYKWHWLLHMTRNDATRV